MGFFSKLLQTVVGVGRAVIGLPPAAAAAVAPVARTTLPVIAGATTGLAIGGLARPPGAPTVVQSIANQLVPGAGNIIQGAIQLPKVRAAQAALAAQAATQTVAMGAPVGAGNGQFVKQTVVQTILVATGAVVRQEILAGAPFLMAKDVTKLRSTAKKLTRAAGKLPRRTIAQSKAKQVTEAVQDAVLRQVSAGCPPKC